jgi:hypothetical protein
MRTSLLLWLCGALFLTGCDGSDSAPPPSKPSSSATSKPGDGPTGPTDTKEPSTDPAAAVQEDGKLALEQLVLTVPEGWQRKEVSSNFLLAEYTLPKPEGEEADGRLTVSMAGGSVEANLERWRDQFGGKPERATEDKKQVGELEITIVDYTGEFNDQRGPFAPPTKRANYRMLAAVIPVEGQLHFIKATGPQATIAAHAERFHQFVESAAKTK